MTARRSPRPFESLRLLANICESWQRRARRYKAGSPKRAFAQHIAALASRKAFDVVHEHQQRVAGLHKP